MKSLRIHRRKPNTCSRPPPVPVSTPAVAAAGCGSGRLGSCVARTHLLGGWLSGGCRRPLSAGSSSSGGRRRRIGGRSTFGRRRLSSFVGRNHLLRRRRRRCRSPQVLLLFDIDIRAGNDDARARHSQIADVDGDVCCQQRPSRDGGGKRAIGSSQRQRRLKRREERTRKKKEGPHKQRQWSDDHALVVQQDTFLSHSQMNGLYI